MGIIVQKYGGNLVKDKKSLLKVANNIIKTHNNGNKLVVVVSAQGNTTDELTKKVYEISSNPSKREVDVVLSAGEQVTIGLLSILLNSLGYKTVSFTGWQAGIETTDEYTDAVISNIDTSAILNSLDQNKIVIVAGFQGLNGDNDITTLGRGGSDTTATYLGAYLNADCCEIYKDTQFIYTADPKLVSNAKKLKYISYDQMFKLSDYGAKVLCNKSISFAKQNNLKIYIKSVETGKIGTVISNEKCNSNLPIIGITKKAVSNDSEKISIVLNEYTDIIEAENVIKEAIKDDKDEVDLQIAKNKNSISLIVSKKISSELLIKIHNAFI